MEAKRDADYLSKNYQNCSDGRVGLYFIHTKGR